MRRVLAGAAALALITTGLVTPATATPPAQPEKQETRQSDEQPHELPHVTRSHAGATAARQAIERIRLELERMNPDRVWTYLLHDVYGYDLKEIGEITGASLAAAQSRLVRGRREIHERIRKDEALARFLRQNSEDE